MKNNYKKQCLLALCFFAAGIFTNNAVAMEDDLTFQYYTDATFTFDDFMDDENDYHEDSSNIPQRESFKQWAMWDDTENASHKRIEDKENRHKKRRSETLWDRREKEIRNSFQSPTRRRVRRTERTYNGHSLYIYKSIDDLPEESHPYLRTKDGLAWFSPFTPDLRCSPEYYSPSSEEKNLLSPENQNVVKEVEYWFYQEEYEDY